MEFHLIYLLCLCKLFNTQLKVKYLRIYWKHDIMNIAVLKYLIYRFSAILIKFLASHFIDIDKLVLKVFFFSFFNLFFSFLNFKIFNSYMRSQT